MISYRRIFVSLCLSLFSISALAVSRPDVTLPGWTYRPAPVSPTAITPAAALKNDEDSSKELQQIQEQQAKAYQDLNASNPLSADFKKTVPTSEAGLQVQKLLAGAAANPLIAAQLKLVSSPTVGEAVKKISQHPNRMMLLYAQIGWIVFMLFFKTWRIAMSTRWYAKLWTRIWTLGLFWIGSLAAIPYAVLGDDYMKIVTTVISALK